MIGNLFRFVRLWLAPAAMCLLMATSARAQGVFNGWGAGDCASCETFPGCQTHHCPPALSHCQEGAPRIRVKCGCPKPICNPCTQPGWGYYETCWSPWPWPPNYNHCATLPPAATVALSGHDPRTPYNGSGNIPGGQMPQQPYARPVPSPIAPNMPPVTSPPLPQTPVMPRLAPTNPTLPTPQPVPGGGIDSLPVPRPENPRPLPPGGNY